jgi:CheY-like chemotaxis protein
MPRSVLVVDDSDVCSTLMEIAFSGLEGIEVLIADSASRALLMLRDSSLDIAVIITDLQLPDKDGFVLIQQLREIPPHEHTPIVVVSGVSTAAARPKLEHHHVSAYFEKPCSPAQLRRTVQDLLL